jgi:hypothetical protein
MPECHFNLSLWGRVTAVKHRKGRILRPGSTIGMMRLAVRTGMLALAMSLRVSAAEPLPEVGMYDLALTRLFTPLSTPEGTYRVYRSPQPLGEMAAALSARDPHPAPGAWKVTTLEVQEAFGTIGRYDPFRLAELYGGRRVTVVRGALVADDGRRRAYTLISPRPDETLSTLVPDTMVIVFEVPF